MYEYGKEFLDLDYYTLKTLIIYIKYGHWTDVVQFPL